jgi:hypothetical protein
VQAQLPRESGMALIGHWDEQVLLTLLYPTWQVKLVKSWLMMAKGGKIMKVKVTKSNIF